MRQEGCSLTRTRYGKPRCVSQSSVARPSVRCDVTGWRCSTSIKRYEWPDSRALYVTQTPYSIPAWFGNPTLIFSFSTTGVYQVHSGTTRLRDPSYTTKLEIGFRGAKLTQKGRGERERDTDWRAESAREHGRRGMSQSTPITVAGVCLFASSSQSVRATLSF